MAKKKDKKSGLISTNATVADNRRARFDYELGERFEAGIVLTGTEVKSLRHGHCSINEAHVGPQNGELWLFNADIAVYQQASAATQHEPKRARKLLMKKKDVGKLMGSTQREGYTIVPTRLYFNSRGLAKVEIALAKGKKSHDKRETEKKRDWSREKARIMRDKG